MDMFECRNCMWEGSEDERKNVLVDNPHNPQDHTLYEDFGCPECGDTFLVNTTEQAYIVEWSKRVIGKGEFL